MHALSLTLLVLAAEPAPALKSLSGLNVPALKPWLLAQLPTLGQCAAPRATEGDEVVSVAAQFGKAPEVTVTRVEAELSDVACVRAVVEAWKRDGKQPSAGPFSFAYRFRPSPAQRAAAAAQAKRAFDALCPLLPQQLTRERVRQALAATKVPLPPGARQSIEDALVETEGLRAEQVSVAISRALRDVALGLGAEQCIRTAP